MSITPKGGTILIVLSNQNQQISHFTSHLFCLPSAPLDLHVVVGGFFSFLFFFINVCGMVLGSGLSLSPTIIINCGRRATVCKHCLNYCNQKILITHLVVVLLLLIVSQEVRRVWCISCGGARCYRGPIYVCVCEFFHCISIHTRRTHTGTHATCDTTG